MNKRWIVEAPSGWTTAVQADTPHRAALEAAKELGVEGLVTNPKAADHLQPRWSVRTPHADLPCWRFVVR